ncbi:MAG: murein L,D-transpeptidase family protein [Hyphomicrobium sp.]
MTWGVTRLLPIALALIGCIGGLITAPRRADALSIELKGVAADRVERQRSWEQGAMPLPGTPDVAILDERLKQKGVSIRAPILIRIFKAESELEVWKEKQGQMVLFATYPICHWSGMLGPKLREGDKQAPEGFYTITKRQLYHAGRWPRSLLLNYPNIYDQAEARTGSDILIHGGCTSVGCFAMTNPVSDEIHRLTESAIDGGQQDVPIHVFPFRMTEENVKSHPSTAWSGFWANLKEGYDAFELTKRIPHVSVCSSRYTFSESSGSSNTGPVEACQTTIATIKDQKDWLDGVTPSSPVVQPVRTAAVDISPPMRLGAGAQTQTDAQTAPAGLTGAAAPAAATPDLSSTDPKSVVQPIAEKPPAQPAIKCRWALRICRKTATLKDIQAARKAARFALGLRLTVILPRLRTLAESNAQ